MKKRLAIVTTHPIQYNAPMFSLLHKRSIIELKVFYTWGKEALDEKYDPGFGKKIKWDIDLLVGYEYEFVENVAKKKGSHHFNGIDNPNIIATLTSFQPDAILVFGWPLKSHYKVMKHFKGKVKVLFRGDSILKDSDNFIRKFLKRIYISWVYHFVDIAFYTGINNKAYFIHYGLKERQLIYAPHAINNSYFSDQLNANFDRATVWRRSLGISNNEVVFLYAGKLDHNKNTKFLLKTFLELKNTNVHLIIAGDGEEKIALEKEFSNHKFIHFLPFQNQSAMPFLYGMADVFVLPSLNETWGLSVNEAMACSTAVLVSSSVGAAPDLVKPGENGFIFNSNDKQDLLQKLQDLSNKEVVVDMGMAASAHIQNWSYSKFCTAIESVMKSLK